MKTNSYFHRNKNAFTLIELLVVITIIGLLAGMIVAIGGPAMKNAKLKRVQVELKNVETAIQSYKEKKGFFPPDNSANSARPPLFYELVGTTYVPGGNPPSTAVFNTKLANQTLTAAQVNTAFGIGGFVNSTTDPNENPVFSVEFNNKQYAQISSGPAIQVLVCPVDGPGGAINPWSYNSSSPTNNPGSFDIWVDVVIGGKTNRICNWSPKPIPF